MRELGIITDSTPVSRKRNAKNWETFGGLSEKINLESSQWDRQSHVQSGLAKNTMILRALLVSTIAVMCVLIFYTLQNYNLLGEYINGVEENNEIFFDIEVSTSVDTRNFAKARTHYRPIFGYHLVQKTLTGGSFLGHSKHCEKFIMQPQIN